MTASFVVTVALDPARSAWSCSSPSAASIAMRARISAVRARSTVTRRFASFRSTGIPDWTVPAHGRSGTCTSRQRCGCVADPRCATWVTAPYFHNGSVSDLAEAVRIMARTQLGLTAVEEAPPVAVFDTRGNGVFHVHPTTAAVTESDVSAITASEVLDQPKIRRQHRSRGRSVELERQSSCRAFRRSSAGASPAVPKRWRTRSPH